MTIRWDRYEDDDGTGVSYRHSIRSKYVETVEVDAIGSSIRITDGCGNSATRDTNATGYQVTVDGMITDSQLQTIMTNRLKGSTASITTDPISDTLVFETVHISQTDELNAWVEGELDDGVLAYRFQLPIVDSRPMEIVNLPQSMDYVSVDGSR